MLKNASVWRDVTFGLKTDLFRTDADRNRIAYRKIMPVKQEVRTSLSPKRQEHIGGKLVQLGYQQIGIIQERMDSLTQLG
jgi:hypothetical protein